MINDLKMQFIGKKKKESDNSASISLYIFPINDLLASQENLVYMYLSHIGERI